MESTWAGSKRSGAGWLGTIEGGQAAHLPGDTHSSPASSLLGPGPSCLYTEHLDG